MKLNREPSKITIRRNAALYRVTIRNRFGETQIINSSHTDEECVKLSEFITDFWCKENGFLPMHS